MQQVYCEGLQYRHEEGVERKCAAGSGEIEEGNSAKSADMRRVTDYIAASILEELGGTTL